MGGRIPGGSVLQSELEPINNELLDGMGLGERLHRAAGHRRQCWQVLDLHWRHVDPRGRRRGGLPDLAIPLNIPPPASGGGQGGGVGIVSSCRRLRKGCLESYAEGHDIRDWSRRVYDLRRG